MYSQLAGGVVARAGYRGCLASLELAGRAVHPLEDALVPSQEVVPGCQGNVQFTGNESL